ncbi:MAG: type II toxin-antitoxin system RelE/ParE family toxin [Acidobacteriota bacterium]
MPGIIHAAQLASRILNAVDLLDGQPSIGRLGRVAGTRELVATGTPYVIPYRVRCARLEIIAVFHGRQKWPERF